MACASLVQQKQNLETYFLIWLDAAVNSSEENIVAQQKLRASINHLTTFDNAKKCEKYIQSLFKDDRIIMIVSGQLGQNVVPRIHHLSQVFSIYIYCMNKQKHQQWTQEFTKVKAVVVELDDLIKQILADHIQRQHNKANEPLPISIFSTTATNEGQSTSEINGHFIHSHLLMDCLTHMKSSATDKDELIHLCKQQYEGNNEELRILEEFHQTYSSSKALWWYTRQSFLYRILNKALRQQNVDLLFVFRFFIRDIQQQLEENRCLSCIRVYRGQRMTKDEVEMLKNSIGEFISVNSFFSTSLNRQRALSFVTDSNVSHDMERVLFEIDADPHLENTRPFSNITSYSYFPDEEEVLFMIGSIFRLVYIDQNHHGIWIVRMQLSTINDHQLQSLLKHLQSEYDDGENSLLSFGDILLKMGRYNEAEKYYRRCLGELPPNHKSLSRCYDSLGTVAMRKDDLDESLMWFNKSLEIKLQTLKANDQAIAENYNSMGKVYRKKGKYDEAIKMFEKALEIWQKTLGDNDLKIAKCYSDMGAVYIRKGNISQALRYHQEALNINEKNLPKYHTYIGAAHINIATAYRHIENYDLSMKHAKLALEIFQKSLPSYHQNIGWVYENIGLIYEKQSKLQDSLSYLQKALDTYQQTLPSTHYYITDVKRNIEGVLSQLK